MFFIFQKKALFFRSILLYNKRMTIPATIKQILKKLAFRKIIESELITLSKARIAS